MQSDKLTQYSIRNTSTPVKGVKNYSISRRLVLSLVITVILVSTITITPLYLAMVSTESKDLLEKAEEYRVHLVGSLEFPLWNYDHNTVRAIGKTFSQNELVVRLIIMNHSGITIYSMEKDHDSDLINRSGKIYRRGRYLGKFEFALTKQHIEKAGRGLLASYATAIILVLASLLVVAGVLVRRLLQKPLHDLDSIVRSYAAGKYDLKAAELPYLEFRSFGNVLAQMGETINEQMKGLQKAEQKYRSIFENATEGIFQETPTGQIITANPAMARMLGYESPAELMAAIADVQTQLYVQPERRSELLRLLEERDNVRQFEIEFYRQDGSRIWTSSNIHTVRDERGQVLHYEGLSEDITEHKRAEEERQANLQFLEGLDKVNRAIQGTNDLEQMMSDVLDIVRSIFDSDRAFFGYPCDPQAPSWRIPMERTRPEYPGASATSAEIPMGEDDANLNRALLASNGPVTFGPGPGFDHRLPAELTEYFGIQSQIIMAIYPKVGKPWTFGTHQCSYRRIWTPEEERLFQEIGCRLTDALTSLLAYQELQHSEERIRLTLEAAQIGIWDWDIQHDRWYASPIYYTMLGYEPKEGLADRSEWLERLHPDDRDMVYAKIQHVLARDFQEYRYEARMRHADGAYRWVFVVGFQIQRDQEGQVTRMLGVRMDITDRKQAEQELVTYREHLEELVAERTEALEQEILERKHIEHALQEAKDAAEAANRAKSVFLANMSHELRTPLNAILGYAQLLWRDPQSTQREALNIILRSGEHLLALINDVLEIARIEAGRIELHPEVCDVGTLLHEVIDMMRNHANAKQLSLTLKHSSDIPRYIQADTSKLRQILVNLIGNAIKFTETGGVTVQVRSHRLNDLPTPAPSQEGAHSAEARTTSLHVEIADTGIGIAAADQDLIFKPFEQIGMLNTTTGSGLGLTITRQYIELMGGTITVESPSPQAAGANGGPGSVFRFELPVQPVSVEAITRERAGGGYVVGLEPGQPVYRILIVEDQFEIRSLLRKILEPVGFEVREAMNGAEAIRIFQAWQPQVIFMDRRMPGMDGLETTRRIKALEHGSKSVIIMLTASAFKEQRDEAFAAGADDFIQKPFRETELFEILRQHLGVRYVYAEQHENFRAGRRKKWGMELTPEALAMLPPDLLNALEQAALQLDLEKMDQVIAAIRPEHYDVAERLAALVQDFRCQEIWTIIQQIRQQERPHE